MPSLYEKSEAFYGNSHMTVKIFPLFGFQPTKGSQATKKQTNLPSPLANMELTQLNIPLIEVRNCWKNETLSELNTWCDKESFRRGKYYVDRFLNSSKFQWFHGFDLSRRTIASINRLRSNHTSLASSLYKLDIIDSPLCSHCDTEETPNHIFWIYLVYIEQRKKLIRTITLARGCLPYPIEYLLVTIDFDIIYVLETFTNR